MNIPIKTNSILLSLLHLHPELIEWESLDPYEDIYIFSKEQHNGLNLFIQSQRETVGTSNKAGNIKIVIDNCYPIINLAKSYGLKIKNKKCICPFHKDTDPSLIFYPKTNSFFCFGCRQGGDAIELVRRLIEHGYKTRSN